MKPFFALLLALMTLNALPALAENRMAGSVPVASVRKTAPSADAQETAKKEADAQAKKIVKKDNPKIEKPAASKVAQGKISMPEQANAAHEAQKAAMQKTAIRQTPLNYVGQIETYKAHDDDTMLTIGEREALGYVELRSANPAMDPWRPGNGTFMILPKMHLLPEAPRKGVVINLSEMRLYYFQKNGEIKTFPIGVGREGFSTPLGTTNVVSKTQNPTWRPTDRMLREDPTLKAFYGPGDDNPLGPYALYLGWPQYRIHGTNKPWGIGRRVSSGCIRMYNANAEYLYQNVPVGTSVTVIRQPIKFGWIGDMLYIEAHPDEMLADQVERAGGNIEYKVPPDIFANLSRAAGHARDQIDWRAVREALKDRRGYPVPILNGVTEAHYFVTPSMVTRAGTSRFAPRLTEAPLEPLVPTAAIVRPDEEKQVEAAPAPRRRNSGFNG